MTRLAWIEGVAVLLAVAFDTVYAAVLAPFQYLLDPTPVLANVAVMALCVVATFLIPHRPNRRYVALVLAVVALVVSAALPPYGITVMVVSGVLASRLSFSRGFVGAAIAWGAIALGLAARALLGDRGVESPDLVLYAVYAVGTQLVLLGLSFAVIALFAKRVELAAAQERSRIALDLHDALGHGLTTLSIQLQSAQRLRLIDPEKADRYVSSALQTVASLLTDVRETVSVLRAASAAPSERLAPMLERLLADFAGTRVASIEWRLDIEEEPSGSVRIALFRVVQEALTNVARHAQATRVMVSVSGSPQGIGVVVEDDGVGFCDTREGTGLTSMRERVASIGGTLAIEQIEPGTRITASAPVRYP